MNKRLLAGGLTLASLLTLALFVSRPTPPSDATSLPTLAVLPTLTSPPLASSATLEPANPAPSLGLAPTPAPTLAPTGETALDGPPLALKPTTTAPIEAAAPVGLVPPAEPLAGQVILTFNPGVTAAQQAAYIAGIGGQVSGRIEALNTVIVRVPETLAAQALPPSPALALAEPDYVAVAQQSSDPLYPDQWALPVIRAPQGWAALPAGAPTVAVAVIDSGVCANHPDLAGRVLPGWDFVDDDADPTDPLGHGCSVAGIIAANADGAGMVGVAPNARLLPLRVLNSQGAGSYSDVAAAIVYAADSGARVINLSLGGSFPSSVLENAINYAIGKGALVIAAAGNTGGAVLYPAAYEQVVAVAAVDPSLERSSFSSFGPQVDLLAPGRDILTTRPNGAYARLSGTSFAAPQVAGVAALNIGLGQTLELTGRIVAVRLDAPGPVVQRPTPPFDQAEPVTQPGQGTPTDTWAVILVPGSDAGALAARLGYENRGPIGALADAYLFRIAGSATEAALAQSTAVALDAAPEVTWYAQQIAYVQSKRTPTDPLYGQQWHLNNTGQVFGVGAGEDINVLPAWNAGWDGTGVVIAVVDDGLQTTHPDIAPGYLLSGSWDINFDDSDPSPYAGDDHGTSAAGVAAARDNTSCGAGSAYRANVSGIRLLAAGVTDAQEAAALTYAYNINDIYSNSWGPSDDGATLRGPGPLTQIALEFGVNSGRGGLGSIFVWAAGNGAGYLNGSTVVPVYDNMNADGYANSRYVIAVAAVGPDGRQSYYSEPGAGILVTAPSSALVGSTRVGITTSDLTGTGTVGGHPDCTSGFGGTSSATPLVSGVVALMLEANPNLGWRDVQHVLVETAEKNDPTDPGWVNNAAGYPVNHKYGFGRVDAAAAVTLGQTWTNVPDEVRAFSDLDTVNQAIPQTTTGAGLTRTLTIPANIQVEHVEVMFTAAHPWRGDIEITLISPSGTSSQLMTMRNFDDGTNYNDWRFMTVRNWGEHSAGTWTLRVVDRFPDGFAGTLNSWQVIVHGTPTAPRMPTPSAPADNSTISTNTSFVSTSFTWDTTNVFSAARYELLLSTDNPPTGTPINVPAPASGYTTELAHGVYYWQIRVVDGNDRASAWSPVRRFTVTTPANAAPIRNLFTATSAPTLTWGRLSWAAAYQIQVDTEAGFAAPVIVEAIVSGDPLEYTTPPLADGVYYWRVRGQDAAGVWGAWSAAESFVVDVP